MAVITFTTNTFYTKLSRDISRLERDPLWTLTELYIIFITFIFVVSLDLVIPLIICYKRFTIKIYWTKFSIFFLPNGKMKLLHVFANPLKQKTNVNIEINKLHTSMLLTLFSVICEIPVWIKVVLISLSRAWISSHLLSISHLFFSTFSIRVRWSSSITLFLDDSENIFKSKVLLYLVCHVLLLVLGIINSIMHVIYCHKI